MPYTHEQLLLVDKPAEDVWEWMSDARNVLKVNMFHESVESAEPITTAGVKVNVPHNFFGVYRQLRQVHITAFRKYYIAFGEHKAPEVAGVDPFPHSQSFTIVPVDGKRCIILNRIKGTYVFPGARYFGERLFRRYMPFILGDDNHVIAAAVGAIDPTNIPKPKGLVLWPFMALGAKFVKSSTRRQIVARANKTRSSAPVRSS